MSRNSIMLEDLEEYNYFVFNRSEAKLVKTFSGQFTLESVILACMRDVNTPQSATGCAKVQPQQTKLVTMLVSLARLPQSRQGCRICPVKPKSIEASICRILRAVATHVVVLFVFTFLSKHIHFVNHDQEGVNCCCLINLPYCTHQNAAQFIYSTVPHPWTYWL